MFKVENFGASRLAKQYGVKRYPAIFIDDVLVAKPKDFGWGGEGGSQGDGRYVPWRDEESQERFKQDLTRMIGLVLEGQTERLRSEHGREADADPEIAALPAFSLTDLDGNALASGDLENRVVVVEFWASWCPPCKRTLDWLAELRGKYGDDVAVLGIAVESPESDVRSMTAAIESEVRWAMGTPEVTTSFGDVLAVPTMFVFDREGKTASVFYGAPDDLHERADSVVADLLAP